MADRKKKDGLGDAAPMRRPLEAAPLMRPKDLAAFLRVSPTTIRRELQAGNLPFVRVRGRIRFIPSEVIEHLRSKRKK